MDAAGNYCDCFCCRCAWFFGFNPYNFCQHLMTITVKELYLLQGCLSRTKPLQF